MKTLTYVCLLICAMRTLSGAAVLPEEEQLNKLQMENNTLEVRVKRWSSRCPSGWFGISDRCFLYVPKPLSWASAERNCLHRGANLASVHSDDEHHAIQSLIRRITYHNNEAWLGGADAHEEGKWFWSDGTLFGYTNWCPGEPNNGGNQDCLVMNFSGQKCWDDQQCYYKHPFVCAKTPKRFVGQI